MGEVDVEATSRIGELASAAEDARPIETFSEL